MEIPKEVEKVKSDIVAYEKRATDIQVTDQKTYESANTILRECKTQIKLVNDKLGPAKKKAHEAHKEISNLINELIEPFQKIQKLIGGKVSPYLQEQERIRQEKIREEQKRLEDKKIKDAEVFEDVGMADEADKILDKNIRVNKEEVAPQMDKGGSFTTTRWSAEVVDKMALIKAVAEGKVSEGYLNANWPALNKLATIKKSEDLGIPGVIGKKDVSVSTRF